MQDIPKDPSPDSSIALLRQGYDFPLKRYDRLDTDTFVARLMLTPALVARGEDAARMFYTPGRFTRRGGIPKTALWSLQDEGSVMALDGARHHHRKAMFMAIFTPETPRVIADRLEAEWHDAVPRFRRRGRTVLLYAARALLTKVLCEWAGVPLSAHEGPDRTYEFGAMVDGAGSVGPRNWRGLALRRRTERWACRMVDETRRGLRRPPEGSPLDVIARFRDADGTPMDLRTAAVELINCIRPSVANDRYIVFAAHALHCYPEIREALGQGADDAALERFANEVRRFYPFIPMMGGRALAPFEWRGHRFERGAWVMLDLYGTNRDPRIWDSPDRFDPDRFRNRPPGAYDLVSHGAGDARLTHRCPGEALTVEIIKRGTRLLLRTPYDVPPQNLTIDPARMPAIPESRFLMRFRQTTG
jgi:fatty-acid peroxygenase